METERGMRCETDPFQPHIKLSTNIMPVTTMTVQEMTMCCWVVLLLLMQFLLVGAMPEGGSDGIRRDSSASKHHSSAAGIQSVSFLHVYSDLSSLHLVCDSCL